MFYQECGCNTLTRHEVPGKKNQTRDANVHVLSKQHNFIIVHRLQRDSVLSLNCSAAGQTCFYVTGLTVGLQVQTQFIGPNKLGLQRCKDMRMSCW